MDKLREIAESLRQSADRLQAAAKQMNEAVAEMETTTQTTIQTLARAKEKLENANYNLMALRAMRQIPN